MKKITSWILRLFAAGILLQTLGFKFTAHPDSVAIFESLGMEPHGRIIIGILELVAGILLIVPSTVSYGAILSWGVMSGAIIGHLTKIGIEGEHFSLFLLAIAVWISSAILMVIHRDQIPILRHMFEKSEKAT